MANKTKEQTEPTIQVAPMPYEAYKAQLAYQAQAESRELAMDQTEPGGRYLDANGEVIDANGNKVVQNRSSVEDDTTLARDPREVERLLTVQEKRAAGDQTDDPTA